MNVSRWPTLLLAFVLGLPSTAAWADACDYLLIRRADFMFADRAQVAATLLVTAQNFDELKARGLEVKDRKLSSFDTFATFDAWRQSVIAAGRHVFDHGPESARAAILASGEDAFSARWAKCQLEEAKKQQSPFMRAWLDRIDDSNATVRLIGSGVPTPQINAVGGAVQIGPLTQPTRPESTGDFVVSVRRSSGQDARVVFDSAGISVGVVVPAAGNSASVPSSGGNRATASLQACAAGEVGVTESSPNRGPEIDDYNRTAGVPLGSPWTFSFISYCLRQAGLDRQLPVSAYGPQLWANALRARLAIQGVDFQSTRALRAGDIYFSGSRDSVGPAGIVIDVLLDGRTFVGVEGNVVADGNPGVEGVFRKTRSIMDIKVGIVRFP